MPSPLHVLIADDSPTVCRMLASVVNATPDMRVIGEANSGTQAVKLARRLHPNVILMDLVMPEMDGLEATREIMRQTPTPIVVISGSFDHLETDIAFRAISAGALMVLQKPEGLQDPDHSRQVAELLNAARAMAGVHVIRHRSSQTGQRATDLGDMPSALDPMNLDAITPPKIVAIASSTGGPAALGEIVGRLPGEFPLPVVVVQHIAPDFVESLAGWLAKITPLQVTIARQGNTPQPGFVYLAPGGTHLRMTAGRRFDLSEMPSTTPHRPSCDILLESVAQRYGPQAVGIILTGMGSDGAHGLQAMYHAGAFTIAQDEATSVVFGMPREAIALEAARSILPLSEIADVLASLSRAGDPQK